MGITEKTKKRNWKKRIISTAVITGTLAVAVLTYANKAITTNTTNSLQSSGETLPNALTLNDRAKKMNILPESMEERISNNAIQLMSLKSNNSINSYSLENSENSGNIIPELASTQYSGHALYADGTIYSWGTNTFGVLGNGNTTGTYVAYSEVPVIDSTGAQITDATQIAAGQFHVMALREDGTVWAWGRNNYGQLGNRTTSTGVTPRAQQVKKSDGTVLENIVKIEVGQYASYALDADGTIWSWGRNNYGQLGTGNTTNQTKGAVKVLNEEGEELGNVKDIQAGHDICIAITNDNKVYGWGRNSVGEFGNGTTDSSYTPIELANITDWKKISVNYYNIGYLKNDGTLWTSGQHSSLGYDEEETGYSSTFKQVRTSKNDVIQNVKDFEYSAASLYVTVEGDKKVYYCGDYGITGKEEDATVIYLAPLLNSDGTYFEKDIARISRQTYDTDFLISTDGIVYTYGYNQTAAMYKYDKTNRYYVSIAGEATERIRIERMLVGETKDLKLKSEDLNKGINIYMKDINKENFTYQIYNTDIAEINSEGEVTAKKAGIAKGKVTAPISGYSMELEIIVEDTYAQVEEGGIFSAELCEDGSVYTWGGNYFCCLGNGASSQTNWNTANSTASEAFNRVKTGASTYLENIVKIAVAEEGVIALDKDGNVWGWGINRQGQLGIGNTTDQPYAKLIYSGEDAVDIATCRWSSTILLKDGSVYTTGSNQYGGLSNRSVPQVSTSSKYNYITSFTLAENYEKIVKIGNGYSTTVGLTIDGKLYTTGGGYTNEADDYTQICMHGDGLKRTEGTTEPIKANLENIVDFKTTSFITIAKTENNDIYTFGSYGIDYNEETKKTTYQNYESPTKIASDVDKIGLSYAAGHFTKLNETGLYSFGGNTNGELGTNSEERYNLTPKKVQDADGKEVTTKVLKIGTNGTNTLTYVTENGTPYGAGWNGQKQLGKAETQMYYYVTAVNTIEPIRLDRMLIGQTLDLQITSEDIWGENNLFNLKESSISYEIYPEYQSIATIDNSGVVTGIGEGRAKGKITDTANNISIDLVIEVEKNYAKIVKNAYGTYALDINGDVYFWGKDFCGLAGNGLSPVTSYANVTRFYTYPTRVKNANDETGYLTNIVDLASTTHSVLALDKNGNVWSFGYNGQRQLGIGNVSTAAFSTAQPVLIAANTPLTGIVKIETLRYSSIAIAKDGSIYTWGRAEEGGLLNGKYATNVFYATRVKSIDKVIEVDSSRLVSNGRYIKKYRNSMDSRIYRR